MSIVSVLTYLSMVLLGVDHRIHRIISKNVFIIIFKGTSISEESLCKEKQIGPRTEFGGFQETTSSGIDCSADINASFLKKILIVYTCIRKTRSKILLQRYPHKDKCSNDILKLKRYSQNLHRQSLNASKYM